MEEKSRDSKKGGYGEISVARAFRSILKYWICQLNVDEAYKDHPENVVSKD